MRDPSLGTRPEWSGIPQVPTGSMASYNRPVNVSSYILVGTQPCLPSFTFTAYLAKFCSAKATGQEIDRRNLTTILNIPTTCDVISKAELFILYL